MSGSKLTPREEIYAAITREREYQDEKWGTPTDPPRPVAEYMLIMESELQEAKRGWVETERDAKALEEILQVVAVGVACLECHGVVEREELTTNSKIQEVLGRSAIPHIYEGKRHSGDSFLVVSNRNPLIVTDEDIEILNGCVGLPVPVEKGEGNQG